ncbi:MAG: inositol monophosphatase [Firmicutes bacterium]|nr:inositol monophosphatase [Bacillota bacterium]MCM1477972.1 inositol monophosphatase [Bacteroides sp.]
MNPTPQQLLDAARQMALEAGREQMKYFRSGHLKVDVKCNESDIVTEADKASEAVILNAIARQFPSHEILSEESGSLGGDSDYRWVIDPLDGTTNFRSGLPNFSVSIGIQYRGETIVGVVYAPYLNEMFCSIKGEGSTLNGNPIHCSSIPSLDRAVLATGFPIDKNNNPDNNLENTARILPHIRGLRRLGSAALDLCYTAAGFLEGYWEMNLHEWDVCAGLLIAEEAGCEWKPFRFARNISIVAAAPQLFNKIYSQLQ